MNGLDAFQADEQNQSRGELNIMQQIMRHRLILAAVLLMPLTVINATEIPQTVEQVCADYDPHTDPLEIEVIREWDGPLTLGGR
jgi:hypothetical protein